VASRKLEVKIVGDPRDLQRAFRRASASTNAFGRDMQLLGRTAKVGAIAGAGGLALLAGAVAKTGFGFNDLRQRSEIAFTTMLGSGVKARKFLDQLQDFAARTPFEFPGLVQASQKMLAMGFTAKQVIPALTAVGDATAGLGGSPETLDRITTALGQIKAKGRLQAEEMLQLTESGVPAWQLLADKIGVSVPKAMELVTKKAVDSNTAIAALVEGMNKRFGGMMEKQSKTFGGLLSTLKDQFAILSGTAMKPFFDLATRGMARLSAALENPAMRERISELSHALAVRLAAAARAVVAFFQANWPSISAFLRDAAGFAFGVARALLDVARLANRAAQAFGGWREVFPFLVAGWASLKLATVAYFVTARFQATLTARTMRAAMISTGIGAIVVAAGLAATLLIQHWGKVRRFFSNLGRAIPRIFSAAWEAIKAGANFAVFGILKAFTFGIRKILQLASHLPFGVGDKAKAALNRIEGFIEGFRQRGSAQMGKAGAQAGDAWGRNMSSKAQEWLRFTSASMAVGVEPGSRRTLGGRGIRGATGNVNAVVLDMARQTAGIAGMSLNVMSGFRPGSKVKGTGKTSLHASGNAVDLGPYYGETLIRIGQAALIAAGMPMGEAKKHTSFAGTVNGWEIIFNSQVGGDHTNHVHVGRESATAKTRKKAPAPAPVNVGALFPAGALAPVSATGGATKKKDAGKSAREKRAEEMRELRQEAREQIMFVRKHLDRIVSEGARARLKKRANALLAALGAADTEKELKSVVDRSKKLMASFKQVADLSPAIRSLQRQSRAVAGELARLPDDARRELGPKMERLRKQLTDVTSKRQLDRIRGQLDKLKEQIADRIEKIRETVERAKDRVGDAWSRLMDRAMSIFDAKTEQLVRQARAFVRQFGFEIGAGEETPAERQLRAFREGREAEERARRRVEIERRIAEAQTDEERRAAQQELADFLAEEHERQLERQAEAERRAADEELERRQEDIRQQRANEREALQDRINDEIERWQRGEQSAEQAQQNIVAILKGHGIDFASAGELLGNAFADGFLIAMQRIEERIAELEAREAALRGATGAGGGGAGAGRPHRPIRSPDTFPMAEGGWGVVARPTRFLAGEAGPEEFFFRPLKSGMPLGGGVTVNVNIGTAIGSDLRKAGEELAEPVRRALLRKAGRGDTIGLG
jgi:tape measure domain-containing protein